MNFPIIRHCFFSDIRKDKWFIALFFLCLFFTNNLGLVMVVGAVISIRLAKERNLARITVHWKIRPVSGLDWAAEIALFMAAVFVLPVFIKQGWTAHSTGLDSGAVIRSCIEAIIWVLATFLAFFAISAISPSGQKFGALAAGVFAVVTVTNIFLGSLPRFKAATPSGYNWMSAASRVPVVHWWWITWLGIILATLLILCLTRLRINRLLLVSGTLLTTLLFALSYHRSENNHYRIQIDEGPASVQLKYLPKEKEGTGQQIFKELEITGLPKGAWVELLRVKVQNSTTGKNQEQNFSDHFGRNSGINGMFAENAFRPLIPKGDLPLALKFNWHFGGQITKETPEHPDRSIFKNFSEFGPLKVRAYGEVYQWEKLGEMPFAPGGFSAKGIHVQLERLTTSKTKKSFRIVYTCPYLKSSSEELENSFCSHRDRGFDFAFVTARHEELKETLMLDRSYGLDVESFRNPNSLFNLERLENGYFQIKEDPRWRILWPEDEVADPTAKWLSGAKLQIYTLKYLGRFDDTIEIPRS